jgi:hypothetical protein
MEALDWPDPGYRALLARVGWIPSTFDFEIDGVSEGQSHHFELISPPGLGIVKAQLGSRNEAGKETLIYEDHDPMTRGHLYCSGQPSPKAFARAWLEPFRAGLVRLSASAVLLNAVILTLAYMRLDDIAKGTTAGVLVAIPGLLSASISRPGEHAVATELLFGVRAFVGMSGLVAFIAGLSLSGGFDPETLVNIWRVLLLAGWTCLIVIAAGYFSLESLRSNHMAGIMRKEVAIGDP